MAKSIMVTLGGESSGFAFAKLERARLYGHKERQVVDADGRRCQSAYLSADGQALIPSGGLALLYVDEGFGTVERSALQAVDDEGAAVAKHPSTLGAPQALVEATPARLLEHQIHTVYELTPETLGSALGKALEAGRIFEAPFCYREEYRPQALFLLRNESGIFALAGTAHGFAMVRREAAPVAATADDADDLADDLDFSMM